MSITPAGGWGTPDPDEGQSLRKYARSVTTDHVIVYEKKSGSAFGKAFFGCLGVLFALWCVFFGTSFINGFVKGFSSSFQETEHSSSASIETLHVSAPALNAAYQANEVAADEKYTHKMLRVFGLTKSIEKDGLGAIHIRISDDAIFSGSLLGVDATLQPGNEDAASGLYRGEGVTVLCPKVQYILGTVTLENCALEVSAPRPQPSAPPDGVPYSY